MSNSEIVTAAFKIHVRPSNLRNYYKGIQWILNYMIKNSLLLEPYDATNIFHIRNECSLRAKFYLRFRNVNFTIK